MSGRRWAVWGGLAALVVLAVTLAPAPPSPTVDSVAARPAARLSASPGTAESPLPTTMPQVARIVPRAPEIDAALPRLWLAPAPAARPASASIARAAVPLAVPAPGPLLAPAAPALAYRLVGRYADAERLGVILQGPDGQVSLAHAGETLGNDYRVESIVGNSMVLRYLPLNLLQTLDIGITR